MSRADRFRLVTGGAGLLAPLALLLILVVLLEQAWPSIIRFGPGFLVTEVWDQIRLDFGALPYIYGTVVTAALALLLAVPDDLNQTAWGAALVLVLLVLLINRGSRFVLRRQVALTGKQ